MGIDRLLVLLGSLIAGILTEYHLPLPEWGGGSLVGLCILAWGAARLSSRRLGKNREAWIQMALASLTAGGVGMTSGSFLSRPAITDSRQVLDYCRSIPADSRALVRLDECVNTCYGERWDATLVDIPSVNDPRRQPSKLVGTPVRINLGATLFRRGDIVSVETRHVTGDTPFGCTPRFVGRSQSLQARLASIRDSFVLFIESTPLNPDTKGFLSAMLTGDRSGISGDMSRSFADAGISHILALSGMHIGILAALCMGLAWPLKVAGKRKWRLGVVLLTIWAFCLVSGMAPSTVRAALMASFYVAGRLLERKGSGAKSMIAAAAVILVCWPDALRDIGFQYSFLCVASLMAFVKPLNKIDRRAHPLLHKLVNTLLVPMVATGGTWALSSHYFGHIPMGFLPLNVSVIPLLPGYLFGGLAYLASSAVGLTAGWLGHMLDAGLGLLRESAAFIGDGHSTVLAYSMGPLATTLWSVMLGAAAWHLNRPRNPRRR